MAPASSTRRARTTDRDRNFFKGLARAAAGALIFGLPMLMTMEMWQLGFYAGPGRLALLLLLLVPLLAGLSRFAGFKESTGLRDDVIDAFVAIAVSSAAAAVILFLFAVLEPGMSVEEIVGKLAIQVVPGSIGAMLARSQLAADADEQDEQSESKERKRHPTYLGELFLMAVGALFLSLNVAPTEEIMLIAFRMKPWQEFALAGVSLVIIHAFVYAIDLRGQHRRAEWDTFWSLLLRFTIVGYALVLLVCLYMLWTFERSSGLSLDVTLSAAIVLGFPAAVGAAAARLIL